MKRYATINQEKLMDIVSKIFVYTVNKKTGKKQIRINPRLNDALLDNLTQQARTYISQLYVNCQQSYDRGVHLYQDIVESIISKTLDKRIDNAENEEYEDMKDINTITDNPQSINQPLYNQIVEYPPNKEYNPSQIDVQPNVIAQPYQEPINQPYQEPITQPYQEPVNQYQEPVTQPYQEPINQYQEPINQPYQEPINQYQKPINQPYQEPVNQYQEPYQKPNNSDIPTVYTNNDNKNQLDNILVSSLRYSNNKGILSDRGVSEQLNKIEFEKNADNIRKNNI